MILACVLMCVAAEAKEKTPDVVDVSVAGEGIGNGGRPLIVATCSAKKADKVTDSDLRRCTVRGVMFKGWADKSNTQSFDASTNHPAICGNADVQILQQNLAYYEQIKRITLLAHHFSMESGELTNTLKIRRPIINKNYKAEIDKMYEE